MEAKDTVMNDEVIKDNQIAGKPWELWRLRKVAQAQAEISFKAGYKHALEGAVMEGAYESIKKVGIREVVEWIEQYECADEDCVKWQCFERDEWQAKLKEWGI